MATKTETVTNLQDTQAAEEIYRKVWEEAPFIFGNEGDLVPPDDISWLDPELIRVGQAWFSEYYALYCVSTIIVMLTSGVSLKPVAALLFRNDKPLNVNAYFRRFLGKLRGVVKFHQDLTSDPDEVRKTFYKVRKMHAMAAARPEKVSVGKPLPEVLAMTPEPWMVDLATAIKHDLSKVPAGPELPPEFAHHLSWEAPLPFNQFGMVYFTVGFFGAVWQRPELFGMSPSKDDLCMAAVIHLWAVFAKLLGLQDEFNIFVRPDPSQIDRICRDVYLHSFRNVDPTTVYLQKVAADGVANHFPLMTQTACLCLALETLGCPEITNVWKLMSLKDKFMYKFLQGLLYFSGTVSWFRQLGNWLFKQFTEYLYSHVLDKVDDKYTF